MISHIEASMFFDGLLTKLQQFVREEGFIYPVLILLKKGEPFEEIEYKNPTVLHIEKADSVFNGDIHRLNVSLRMETLEDDSNLPRIAKDLVRITNADAVGIVMGCVYREIPVGKNTGDDGEIYRDPDSIRILNHCYYLKSDPNCYMRMIPYVNRGPVAKSEDNACPVLDTDEGSSITGSGPYEVLFINFPWIKPTKYNKAKLPDPYRR